MYDYRRSVMKMMIIVANNYYSFNLEISWRYLLSLSLVDCFLMLPVQKAFYQQETIANSQYQPKRRTEHYNIYCFHSIFYYDVYNIIYVEAWVLICC